MIFIGLGLTPTAHHGVGFWVGIHCSNMQWNMLFHGRELAATADNRNCLGFGIHSSSMQWIMYLCFGHLQLQHTMEHDILWLGTHSYSMQCFLSGEFTAPAWNGTSFWGALVATAYNGT